MRAAVFAGSFDAAAAQRVCGGNGLPTDEIPEVLAGLVAKSVLISVDVAGQRRYRLLETIGQYGMERLRDPSAANCPHHLEEAALRKRHLEFYLGLAEQFHTDWFGARQLSWSRRPCTTCGTPAARCGRAWYGWNGRWPPIRTRAASGYVRWRHTPG